MVECWLHARHIKHQQRGQTSPANNTARAFQCAGITSRPVRRQARWITDTALKQTAMAETPENKRCHPSRKRRCARFRGHFSRSTDFSLHQALTPLLGQPQEVPVGNPAKTPGGKTQRKKKVEPFNGKFSTEARRSTESGGSWMNETVTWGFFFGLASALLETRASQTTELHIFLIRKS